MGKPLDGGTRSRTAEPTGPACDQLGSSSREKYLPHPGRLLTSQTRISTMPADASTENRCRATRFQGLANAFTHPPMHDEYGSTMPAHHIASGGEPASNSPMRRWVEGVTSSGSRLSSNHPASAISWLGRICRTFSERPADEEGDMVAVGRPVAVEMKPMQRHRRGRPMTGFFQQLTGSGELGGLPRLDAPAGKVPTGKIGLPHEEHPVAVEHRHPCAERHMTLDPHREEVEARPQQGPATQLHVGASLSSLGSPGSARIHMPRN